MKVFATVAIGEINSKPPIDFFYFFLTLDEFLIGIYNNSTEDVKIKMQSLFVLKNLIRIETSSNNRGNFKSLNQTCIYNNYFSWNQ